MRNQIIKTIDTECRRKSGESEHDFQVRVDVQLTYAVNAQQQLPAWENWDLLSVSATNKQGVFLTTWEYDPELHDDVKSDGDTSEEKPMPAWQRGIFDEVFGERTYETNAVSAFPSVHQLQHGDAINVNGDIFVLTEYYKTKDGSDVFFTSVDKLSKEEPEATSTMPRAPRFFSQYGRSMHQDYGRP